jgi:hypothetical protein
MFRFVIMALSHTHDSIELFFSEMWIWLNQTNGSEDATNTTQPKMTGVSWKLIYYFRNMYLVIVTI